MQSAVSGLSQDISDAIEALDVAQSGGSGKYISAISETDGKISATEGTIDTTVTQGSNNPVTSDAVNSAIESAIASVYKPSGNKTCAELVSSLLVRANLGNVYNITDSGTTTSDFAEGAGKPIKAGDNVAIVDVGTASNPSYKFDLLSGMIDLSNYIQKSQTQGLVKNDGTIDTTAYAKQSEMSVTPGTGANDDKTTIQLKTGTEATVLTKHLPAGTATPQMDGVGNAGSSTNYARADHVHPSDTTKQDKTLATALTIDGSVKTTVEDALSALNSAKLNSSSVTGTVESGNNNPVSSNGVNSAIQSAVSGLSQDISDAIEALDVAQSGGSGKYISAISETDGKISATEGTIDTAVTSGSNNPVTGGAVSTALNAKQDTLIFDDVPTENSNNPVKSGGVYTALQSKVNTSDIASSVQSGNNNPVSSESVANALALPTDAVLHYSFDEVPDYPDGSADVRLLNSNTYKLQNGVWKLCNNSGTTFTNVNGNIVATISTGEKSNGFYFAYGNQLKIIKMKIKVTSIVGGLRVQNGAGTNAILIDTITKNGEFAFYMLSNTNAQFKNIYVILNNTSSSATVEISQIYIGDGSFNTPIIDNSGNNNNATNNGCLAVQGLSGKAIRFLGNSYTQANTPFDVDNTFVYTVSVWVRNWDKTNICALFNNMSSYDLTSLRARLSASTDTVLVDVCYEARKLREFNFPYNFSSDNVNEYHIVLVANNTQTKLYINGQSINGSYSNQTYSTLGKNWFQIGRQASSSSNYIYTKADIDDFQMFDRALSAEEVNALYLNKANTPKYYDLNDYRIENADTAPAENSNDLITSGAVYEAMQSSGSVKSVCSQLPDANGNVSLDKSDVGLGNVANTGDSATPAQNGTAKFTTGGAFDFFAKCASSASWLGKVFGRFMGRKWAKVNGEIALSYASQPVYANGLWEAGSSISSNYSGIWWSEDGINWTKGTGQMGSLPYTPAYANGLWLAGQAIGTGGVFKSSDGKTWEKITTLPANTFFDTPVYVNGLWYAISGTAMPYWSEDGDVWTAVTGDSTCTYMEAPSYANGLWLAGSTGHGFFKSEDGKSWTQVTGTTASYTMYTPVYANGRWVAGSNEHGLWWSTDGVTWTQVTVNTSENSFTPIYANGLFVTNVSNLGLWWSEDGKTWTQGTGGNTTNKYMKKPVYANGIWVAGSYGGMYWSEDGKTWVRAVTDFAGSLEVETPFYGNGMLLAVFTMSTQGSGFCYSDIEMALEELTD